MIGWSCFRPHLQPDSHLESRWTSCIWILPADKSRLTLLLWYSYRFLVCSCSKYLSSSTSWYCEVLHRSQGQVLSYFWMDFYRLRRSRRFNQFRNKSLHDQWLAAMIFVFPLKIRFLKTGSSSFFLSWQYVDFGIFIALQIEEWSSGKLHKIYSSSSICSVV